MENLSNIEPKAVCIKPFLAQHLKIVLIRYGSSTLVQPLKGLVFHQNQ